MRALNTNDMLTTELLSTIRTTYAQPSSLTQFGFNLGPAVETLQDGGRKPQQSAIPSMQRPAGILGAGQQASVDVSAHC